MSYGSSGYNNPPPWTRSSASAHTTNISSYPSIGGPTYPIKRPHSPDDYSSSYQPPATNKVKSSSGYVTKLYDTWGIIDNEIQFSFSACSKGIPKMKEFVTVDAIHSPGTTYKWRATKVILISNGRDYSNLKPIPNSRPETDYRRPRVLDRSRERSRERRYDEIDRKRFKRDEKDDKIRDFDKDTHKEREKPIRDFERSPIRRSRSPVKRKIIRYCVKVPGDVLTLTEGDIITLKRRYPVLYIPSDFFSSKIRWNEAFPPSRPFTLNKPCSFHVMHRDCDPYVHNDAIVEPPDLDYTFSAKVMLISVPRLDEIYRRTICLAEDLPKADDRTFTNFTRQIQFLVGSRGKNEPLAIGGPWSSSLDGENPDKDPSVLVKTAIRTCKALTGIDLSACPQWYRFMEVHYHRSESVHKGKTYPARVETVVFFLPEVWNCVPSCLEWDTVRAGYKNLMEGISHPKTADGGANADDDGPGSCVQAEEEIDKEEDLVVIDKCEEKIEPTHHSQLNPKNMQVTDVRQELEARSLSWKGPKKQLIGRLEAALKKEREMEEKAGNSAEMIESPATPETLKVVDVVQEENDNISMNEESKTPKKDEVKKDVSEVKVPEIVDRAVLEKRYTLPDTPQIVVHPSRTAKAGKFDCFVMSLSCLLDYRANDNKEHSFELFLFAELFLEMLQRDFGFQIYKALCEAPEKAKEDEKDTKKADKSNSPEKSGKAEEKDEVNTVKDDRNEKRLSDSKGSDEKSENDVKSEEGKKKDRGKMVTKNPFLLLSFTFFDKSHCGYILDRDLENLFFSLGLHLSRHQVKKLISKVVVRETLHYRKLTDKSESEEDDQAIAVDVENIALGNNKYFPVFSNENRTGTSPQKIDKECTDASSNKKIVCIDGAVVDVEKVTANLKKSESTRLELEDQLLKNKKEVESLRDSLKRSSDREKRLNDDNKSCRNKLAALNKEKQSYTNKSRTYYKLLMNIKDQISFIEEKSEKNSTKSTKSTEKIDDNASKAGKSSEKIDESASKSVKLNDKENILKSEKSSEKIDENTAKDIKSNEKVDENSAKSAKSCEKIDEKTPAKSKKGLPEEDASKDESDTSLLEKKTSSGRDSIDKVSSNEDETNSTCVEESSSREQTVT